jgi:iron complex transport system permease protein
MQSAIISGRVFRLPGLSFRYHQRAATIGVILGGLILALGIWSLAAGEFPIALNRVFATLIGQGEGSENFVILNLRLPRVLTGICCGLCFGVAGALLQSLARNPLASPDIIGFDAGAAFGAVATVIVFGGTGAIIAAGAIGGGLAAAAIVMLAAWSRGVLSPMRLVLVGIGAGAFFYAGMQFLLTRSDIFEASAAQAWLTGSLNARVWLHVQIAAFGALILVPLGLSLHASLERLEMGDDLAAALGTRVEFARIGAGLVAVMLAAVAVACAGPLPFVALAAAPLARRMTGASGPTLLGAGLVGATIVLGADLAGRLLFAPVQLPAGIFTAVLGAPYLLWLLATQIRKGAM